MTPTTRISDTGLGVSALSVASWTAMLAAAYTGLVVTAILATLPAMLSQAGASDAVIGVIIGSYFVGRLVFQVPLGMLADRMDLRLLIAIVAAITGGVALLGWFLVVTQLAQIAEGAPRASHLTLLGVTALLGGVTLPVYTLAMSLGFARTDGQASVKVATTLLLANSGGAVAGPIIVAVLLPIFGWTALIWVIVSTSVLMTTFALAVRRARGAHGPSATPKVEIPATSVVLTESIAEVRAKATAAAVERDN